MSRRASDIAGRLVRLAASAQLAAWLIGAQVAFILVSYAVPQRGIFPEEQMRSFFSDIPAPVEWLVVWLGLDHAFTSLPFYFLASLLVLNLLLCTVDRVLKRARGRSVPARVGIPDGAFNVYVSDIDETESALDAVGARAAGDGETAQYYLRRGNAGFIGSIVMHAGLVLVVVAGVVSGLTTFRGEIVLTEGQTLPDSPDSYLSVGSVPVLGSAFEDFSVALERMEFTYVGNDVTDAVAHMVVTDSGGSSRHRAKVNYPLKVYGKSFLLQDGGHSVWLKVESPNGEVLVDSFINLLSVTPQGYSDSVLVNGTHLALVSRPDASKPVDESMTQGLDIVSPIVGVAVGKAGEASGHRWITPGAPSVTVGGLQVSIKEVRTWNRFLVRADNGRYPMYIAFGLIILGGLVRFLDPDRWLRADLARGPHGARLHVWGSGRYRPGELPKEGRALLRSLQEADVTRLSEEEPLS